MIMTYCTKRARKSRARKQRMGRAAAHRDEGDTFFETILELCACARDGGAELLPRQAVNTAKDENRCAVEIVHPHPPRTWAKPRIMPAL